MNARPKLITLAAVFFRLGLMGFGGPVALVALMELETTRSRNWISPSDFLERFVICKMLPGPIAFQMALWIGSHVRGVLGALAAGLSFLLPGAALITLLAMFYAQVAGVRLGMELIAGMRIGAVVVIWDSAVRLFEPFHRRRPAWLFLLLGFVMLYVAPSFEPLVILFGGVASVALRHRTKLFQSPVALLAALFWVHFKAGAFTFGTGLAIIPILQRSVVQVYQWMAEPEFLDAVAFGQITPGPVTLTSTYVGFRAGGLVGACVATLGMYLPGCLVILGLMPLVFPRIKRAQWLPHFSAGAIPTVIGCIFAASIGLAASALTDWRDYLLGATLLTVSIRLRLVGWKLILLSALGYWLLHRI